MKRFARRIRIEMRPRMKYPYRLLEDIVIRNTRITNYYVNTTQIKLAYNGDLTIRKGYTWDGATGAIDTIDFMLASLVHDVLYQLMRRALLPINQRKRADNLLITIAQANGMTSLRAVFVYIAVRLFGRQFAIPKGNHHEKTQCTDTHATAHRLQHPSHKNRFHASRNGTRQTCHKNGTDRNR